LKPSGEKRGANKETSQAKTNLQKKSTALHKIISIRSQKCSKKKLILSRKQAELTAESDQKERIDLPMRVPSQVEGGQPKALEHISLEGEKWTIWLQ